MSLNILMITDNDPAGMAIAFTHAVNRYTPHRCRLITTQVKYVMDYDTDIHLSSIPDEDFSEVEALLINADVIHFHVLFDEHRMLGPFAVRDYLEGKTVIYHHHGHPEFLLNAERYRERYLAQNSTVLVSTPDLRRQIPEATWMPNLVPLTDPRFQPRPDDFLASGPVRICQAPTRKYDKHTDEFLEVSRALKARFQDQVQFQLLEGMSWAECLRAKRRCHIVFDHMRGHFGISSLESLAQGVPVIAGLDPFNIEQMCAFSGTDQLPWVVARDRQTLEARLVELIESPERRVEVGRQSRQFMESHWSEQDVMRVLLPFYEGTQAPVSSPTDFAQVAPG